MLRIAPVTGAESASELANLVPLRFDLNRERKIGGNSGRNATNAVTRKCCKVAQGRSSDVVS